MFSKYLKEFNGIYYIHRIMNAVLLLALSGFCLVMAYMFYGRWLAKKWGVDPGKKRLRMS